MTWLVSLMSVFLLCCSCVAGPTTTTCSTSGPATQPAGSGDPRVDAILERLERRGQEVADLSARLTWQLYDQIVEEKYINRGQMLYKRQEPNARFLIRFDEQIMGRRSRPQKKFTSTKLPRPARRSIPSVWARVRFRCPSGRKRPTSCDTSGSG